MSYDIKRSPLFNDIKSIIQSPFPVSVGYKLIVHTRQGDLESPKFISYDIIRDYIKKYTDQVFVRCIFPLGDFVKEIYPNRELLECTLITYEAGSESSIRYRAIIPPENYATINMSSMEALNKEDLNRSDIFTLTLQLMHRRIEPIHLLKVRGTFREITRDTLLINTILETTASYTVDGKPLIDNVYLDEPNNNNRITQLPIPTNTPLLELANHIQNKEGGIYNAGIGNYIQPYDNDITWFIYPPYDVHRYQQSDDKLVILVMDSKYDSIFDKTFKIEDGIKTIIVSRSIKEEEIEEQRPTRRNLGVRISSDNKLVNRPHQPDNGKIIAKSTEVKKELVFKNKDDGVDTIEDSFKNTITSNKHKMVSSIAYSAGKRMDFVWQRSDNTLLYPGMPVEIYFEKSATEVEIKRGKLLFNHTLYGISGNQLQSNRYRSVTTLSVFVET